MTTELKELIEQLSIEKEKAIKLPSGGGGLNHDFDINPDDFLQRAEDDYELGGHAALLNAITNAKRAIHCQIDQALICLGFDNKRKNLPQKAELLVDLGFVTPRILRRVTNARNVLEHEYKAPSLNQVAEALDLAALFIEATKRHLDSFGDEFSIGNYDEQVDSFHCSNELSFSFLDKPHKHFRIWARRNVQEESKCDYGELVGNISILPRHEVYKDIVRIVVAGDREAKVDMAIERLFGTLHNC